jgi:pteridine reductase
VHYHRSRSGADATVSAITKSGGEAHAFQGDLGDVTTPERLVAEILAHFGALHGLVNSAASMLRTPLDEVTPSAWDEVFALNLRGPFFLCLAAARAMPPEGGAIVNISDHMAFESWPSFVPHGIAKAGVAAMTHQLAAALAPRVRVNGVVPGAVLAPASWPEAEQRRFAEATPLQRIGTPGDVAGAVRYLLTAPYVTGQLLFVDGGRHGAR